MHLLIQFITTTRIGQTRLSSEFSKGDYVKINKRGAEYNGKAGVLLGKVGSYSWVVLIPKHTKAGNAIAPVIQEDFLEFIGKPAAEMSQEPRKRDNAGKPIDLGLDFTGLI